MIVIMGVAGSGKSLQGRMLADQLGLPWLSTGEFLRMLVTGNVRKRMINGELLDDKEIIALLQQVFELVDTSKSFVLDGFPRTAKQAEWLLSQAKFEQINVDAVVHLVASKEVVKDRLLNRGRADDTESAIVDRFNEYEQTATEIMQLFKNADVPVIDINSEGEKHAIQQNIRKSLESIGCIQK